VVGPEGWINDSGEIQIPDIAAIEVHQLKISVILRMGGNNCGFCTDLPLQLSTVIEIQDVERLAQIKPTPEPARGKAG